jgi:Zn-dependent membrane protease YugP
MIFFNPMYMLLVVLPGLLISGIASFLVKSAFKRYSRVGSMRGYTGAQAAQTLLDRAGIHDVRIVPARGFLSDHYNPTNKTLALSEQVYSSNSVAAIGVATHEAGHAIQHATHYAPLWLRSALVPTVGIGSNLGMIMMTIGLFMQGGANKLGDVLVVIGAILFSAVLLFQLVTLPVEFNASSRAKRLVVEAGIVFPEERTGIDKVLNAAALTYVAAVLQTLLTLLYFLWRAGLFGGRRE